MVFCCIAIVGFAMVYFAFLSLRQLFSGPSRDPKHSSLPPPPRAMTGNGAQPVFGHTWLFRKVGGDIALEFSPSTHEWSWLPRWLSRPLRECFSVFIWGQWRVVVKGPARVARVMEMGDLREDWAWSAPVSLLGCHCPSLLEEQEAEMLMDMISPPLSHRSVVHMAPEFAEKAEKLIDDIVSGKEIIKAPTWREHASLLRKNKKQPKRQDTGHAAGTQVPAMDGDNEMFMDEDSAFDDIDVMDDTGSRGSDENSVEVGHKIKFRALRSYTFDLIDGPILKFDRWSEQNEQPQEKRTQEIGYDDIDDDSLKDETEGDEIEISRGLMLLWMERLKRAMCVIKMTFGAEWMYIWLMNEYGRAVNARMKLQNLISKHIDERSKIVSENVKRCAGHAFFDPFAMPFPIVTMAQNLYSHNHYVTGHNPESRQTNRTRTRSDSELNMSMEFTSYMDAPSTMPTQEVQIASMEDSSETLKLGTKGQDSSTGTQGDMPIRPSLDKSISTSFLSAEETSALRARTTSCPEVLICEDSPSRPLPGNDDDDDDGMGKPPIRKPRPILDSILRQQDADGNGLTNAATTDLAILLWMIMDAGNAWTAMALNLLALDPVACTRVQQELDLLVGLHGRENLFRPEVMEEMIYLDALLYEAIRLCPPFLGGLKMTTNTVDLPDAGVQIPKNTNVIFCQPTDESFDLTRAVGKKPQSFADTYPCPELFGFLPFDGQEVPIMVLQSKVFVAVLLQRFSPYLSKKRTFIRKIKTALSKGLSKEAVMLDNLEKGCNDDDDAEVSSIYAESSPSDPGTNDSSSDEIHNDPMVIQPSEDTTQTEAMKLFDKIPFPEPRRVMRVKERQSALNILGVSKLGHQPKVASFGETRPRRFMS